jgi:hypothetical protein
MLDRTKLTLFLTLFMASLSGCDSGGSSPAQTGDLRPTGSVGAPPAAPPVQSPPSGGAGGGTTGQGSAVLGTSCTSTDKTHQCIALKIVSYKDSSGTDSISQTQAVNLVAAVNTIWSQCNVAFEIDDYVSIDPTTVGLSYGNASQNELGTIRQNFSDSKTFLLAATGPWSSSYIAWTEMPGGAPYGSVVDAQSAKNTIPVAHELGHYQGLDHVQTAGNVMYPVVYSTDTNLTSSQCSTAQSTNTQYWQAMFR